MLNIENLQELAAVEFKNLQKEELTDASELVLDYSIPMEERATWLATELKNPYCFRVGEVGVKLEFAQNEQHFEDIFIAYLRRQKTGL